MSEPMTAAPVPVATDGPGSLFSDVRPPGRGTRAWPRQVGLIALTVIVVFGALGGFGVHSSTATARGNGYTLQVHYAHIARPGLDVPFRVTVTCPTRCTQPITIAVTQNYFRIFETQGFFPDTNSMTSDGTDVYLTFDKAPASASRFVVDYDAYIQPGSHAGTPARVRLIIGGQTEAALRIHTWLVP